MNGWTVEYVSDPWTPEVGDRTQHPEYGELVIQSVNLQDPTGCPFRVVRTDGGLLDHRTYGHGALVGLGFWAAKVNPRLQAVWGAVGWEGKDPEALHGQLLLAVENGHVPKDPKLLLWLGSEIGRVWARQGPGRYG